MTFVYINNMQFFVNRQYDGHINDLRQLMS